MFDRVRSIREIWEHHVLGLAPAKKPGDAFREYTEGLQGAQERVHIFGERLEGDFALTQEQVDSQIGDIFNRLDRWTKRQAVRIPYGVGINVATLRLHDSTCASSAWDMSTIPRMTRPPTTFIRATLPPTEGYWGDAALSDARHPFQSDEQLTGQNAGVDSFGTTQAIENHPRPAS
jgi:hypothetical protein